jgi:D-alanyl-D-alanine carboxypeptidase/D-alanyl-D-alanine-endopeptidase (penicillin-binding protein 4)
MLRRLHVLGLRTVDGRLAVRGPLLFNWERDPAGSALASALSGKVADTVWATVGGGDTTLTLREAALTFRGRGDDQHNQAEPLLVYRSPPLLAVLKALNGYSNNIFHLASDTIGGPTTVTAIARAAVPPALRDEILITNAAGAGTENRISPRAAVALLQALARELGRSGHDLTAVLPVSGIDPGTLHDRLLTAPAGRGIVVGKTGTYGSEGASALAGALHTKRFGTVIFAVLNRDVPVPEARRRQDAFVAKLVTATGAEPWRYTTAAAPAFDEAQLQ